jgi:hypothetical protein
VRQARKARCRQIGFTPHLIRLTRPAFLARHARLALYAVQSMHGDFSKNESYTSTQQAEDKPGLSGLFGLSRVFG